MSNEPTEAQVIETGIEVLKATGWCSGDLGDTNIKTVDGDGEHCTVGALAASISVLTGSRPRSAYRATTKTLYGRAADVLYYGLPKSFREEFEDRRDWRRDAKYDDAEARFIIPRVGDRMTTSRRIDALVSFNDREGTTKRHVYNVFRRALKKANEAQG